MTQKELLYVEDAIMHEKSIISILEDSKEKLDNGDFISFINGEITKHQDLQNNLISLLGGLNG